MFPKIFNLRGHILATLLENFKKSLACILERVSPTMTES